MSGILIIGASHSGIGAASALRSAGYEGTITVVTQERHLPYHRPPLSKEGLSAGDYKLSLLRPESFYRTNRIDLVLGQTIASLHLNDRYALGTDGRHYDYTTLILACGAEPRQLPPSIDPQGVALYLRTYDDFQALKSRLSSARSIAIVGGGLIGLEVAAMAVSKGLRATLVEAGERLMERTVSRSIANYLLDRHLANGLDVRLGASLTSIGRDENRGTDRLTLNSGETIDADLTVAAIGVSAHDGLAQDAGLSVENGILASEYGRTSDPAVYAIGDCAAWFDPVLGRHVRCEAVNPGQDQAKIVAAAITGSVAPARKIPRYWSHQAAIQVQMAGGVLNSETEAVLKGPVSGAFSVLGLKGGRLVAVQSVNAPQQFTKLQELIGVERDALAATLDVEFPPPRH